jgi:alpha-D-ribose 1-methylphosphonate 5-triphosphate synthase subunit PhnL
MASAGPDRICLDGVAKTFIMHLRGGARLPVVRGVSFSVRPGECVALAGPSGIGKSSILKLIYGNYRVDAGRILVTAETGTVDVASATPRQMLALRRTTLGYVSQFLRTIPRVGALEIVAAAAREEGVAPQAARARAGELLAKLNIAHRLWHLPPATFSGGEQQRVNIARGLASRRPILLLDEPTAALDDMNRTTVMELIAARKREGTAVLGIFHDADIRKRVADRIIDVTQFSPGA